MIVDGVHIGPIRDTTRVGIEGSGAMFEASSAIGGCVVSKVAVGSRYRTACKVVVFVERNGSLSVRRRHPGVVGGRTGGVYVVLRCCGKLGCQQRRTDGWLLLERALGN